MQDNPSGRPRKRMGPRPLALPHSAGGHGHREFFAASRIVSTISSRLDDWNEWMMTEAGAFPSNPFDILPQNPLADADSCLIRAAAPLADRSAALAQALDEAARRRWGRFWRNCLSQPSYRRSDPRPRLAGEQHACWIAVGAASRFSWSRRINRATVLDLLPDQSFLTYFSGSGFRPFWLIGRPGR